MKDVVGFVHGFGFPNRFLYVRHWGRIPNALKGLGFTTVEFETDVYGSVYSNSLLLAAQIDEYLQENPADRLFLFCHSRGAIEAGLAVADSKHKGRIRAIVGLGAPLFGSYLARYVHGLFPKKTHLLYRLLNIVGYVMGDNTPDAFRTIDELSKEWIQEVQRLKTVWKIRFVLVYSRMSYLELPLVFRLLKRMCSNDRIPGDGIADFPFTETPISIEMLALASIEAGKMTHWALTGLPALLRASLSDSRKIYRDIGKRLLSEATLKPAAAG